MFSPILPTILFVVSLGAYSGYILIVFAEKRMNTKILQKKYEKRFNFQLSVLLFITSISFVTTMFLGGLRQNIFLLSMIVLCQLGRYLYFEKTYALITEFSYKIASISFVYILSWSILFSLANLSQFLLLPLKAQVVPSSGVTGFGFENRLVAEVFSVQHIIIEFITLGLLAGFLVKTANNIRNSINEYVYSQNSSVDSNKVISNSTYQNRYSLRYWISIIPFFTSLSAITLYAVNSNISDEIIKNTEGGSVNILLQKLISGSYTEVISDFSFLFVLTLLITFIGSYAFVFANKIYLEKQLAVFEEENYMLHKLILIYLLLVPIPSWAYTLMITLGY